MSLSEEGKARLMVVAIVAMLAVTMVVAGWQYEEESEQPEIDVDEGFDEITIKNEEIPDIGKTRHRDFEENRTIVTTEVNGNSSLTFELEVWTIFSGEESRRVSLDLRVEGDFDSNLNPDMFYLTGEVYGGDTSHLNYQYSYL